jgi:hypothetical protein
MWPRAARRNLGNDPLEGELVKSDSETREDVIYELQWDPQISSIYARYSGKLGIRSRVDLAGWRWSTRGPRRRKPQDWGM